MDKNKGQGVDKMSMECTSSAFADAGNTSSNINDANVVTTQPTNAFIRNEVRSDAEEVTGMDTESDETPRTSCLPAPTFSISSIASSVVSSIWSLNGWKDGRVPVEVTTPAQSDSDDDDDEVDFMTTESNPLPGSSKGAVGLQLPLEGMGARLHEMMPRPGCARPVGNGEIQWCFSQVKGALDDDVTEADIVSCVEFNDDGEFLATGDKGGRVVIFSRDKEKDETKEFPARKGEYSVYSTFQSHEPEFDYLKSLEIEEKINKIKWLKRKNPAHFLLSTNDKTIKLWRVSEKDFKVEGFNIKDGCRDPQSITSVSVPRVVQAPNTVEASLRRVFANAHTYHINSISVNSDQETYLSADDLRINLWNLEITDQSFNIVDIKPANMEELTEVITASEFHPSSCNLFVYSSSKGTIRLCDMRAAALCDKHSKLFDEPEDPTNRSFFSEIISSISDVKFSYSGRYMVSRDYLSIKVWDLHMETRPIECYPVHEYLRSKLCSLYENDCIFDKFECCWNGTDTAIMTGSYNNFFRLFDRNLKKDCTLEASREIAKPKTILKPRKVINVGQPDIVGTTPKRKKDEIGVDCLDFSKKILHTAWHPKENIIAVAATNNLYIFQDKC